MYRRLQVLTRHGEQSDSGAAVPGSQGLGKIGPQFMATGRAHRTPSEICLVLLLRVQQELENHLLDLSLPTMSLRPAQCKQNTPHLHTSTSLSSLCLGFFFAYRKQQHCPSPLMCCADGCITDIHMTNSGSKTDKA